jgi:hypothetical protein
MTYRDGSYYAGHWKDGKRHGKGTFFQKAEQFCFIGHFVEGQMHGRGEMRRKGAARQVGTWVKGKFDDKSAPSSDAGGTATLMTDMELNTGSIAGPASERHTASLAALRARLEDVDREVAALTGAPEAYRHGSDDTRGPDEDDE